MKHGAWALFIPGIICLLAAIAVLLITRMPLGNDTTILLICSGLYISFGFVILYIETHPRR